jgi:Rrf2 family transcriptional regulator, nitric oxide-sensitive transcriptional repressor
MQLSRFSDYTLRVLIFLSVSPEENVSAQLIAERYGISFHHVAKAAQWLAREGYVVSNRGRGGGMALARSAAEISLGEVLRKTESRTQLVECLRGEGHACVITRGCGLRGALLEAEAAFFQSLDKKALADAVGAKQSLVRALQLSSKRASG